jgi:nucleoside-diphosphate-sugar epimerase
MRILISGSNGIIGQQLLELLLNDNNNDEFFLINRSLAKVPEFINFKKVHFKKIDFLKLNYSEIQDIIKEINPEIIFHLAWITDHNDYLTSPENIKWESFTKNLIDIFYLNGGRKFIGIGTSLEYDWKDSNFIKLNEFTTKLSGSDFLYGKSKLNTFHHLESLKDIEYLWCRVFFVFGPNQSDSRLFPKILKSLGNKDNPIPINFNIKRDYISTYEIANQLKMLMKTNYSGPVNICSGISLKLNFFIDYLSNISKRPANVSKIEYVDNFEKIDVCGDLGVINMLFKDYKYTEADIQRDILKYYNYTTTK